MLGQGSFKISPVVGHHAQVRTDKFNLDDWISVASDEPQTKSTKPAALDSLNTPEIPLPQRVDLKVKELTLAALNGMTSISLRGKRSRLADEH